MKAITLIAMMKQEEYQCLTCKEFAEIVERAGVLDNRFKIPDYMNAAISEQDENERQERIEKRERYADYSDQEEK